VRLLGPALFRAWCYLIVSESLACYSVWRPRAEQRGGVSHCVGTPPTDLPDPLDSTALGEKTNQKQTKTKNKNKQLKFRGSFEAKSSARGPKIDPPGTPGRAFDLKCRSCGRDRRCMGLPGLWDSPQGRCSRRFFEKHVKMSAPPLDPGSPIREVAALTAPFATRQGSSRLNLGKSL
jgi:hypothetical protein